MTRWLIYNLYFPLALFFSRIFRNSQEKIETHLIRFNNKLRIAENRKPENILILTPSCLQNKDCGKKVVDDVLNCIKCGKCRVKDLLDLSEKHKIKLAIATGGRLARKILIDTKADAVIAVACEKELISGIMDTYPIAVYAIINKRPYGPCLNTDVDAKEIDNVLRVVLK